MASKLYGSIATASDRAKSFNSLPSLNVLKYTNYELNAARDSFIFMWESLRCSSGWHVWLRAVCWHVYAHLLPSAALSILLSQLYLVTRRLGRSLSVVNNKKMLNSEVDGEWVWGFGLEHKVALGYKGKDNSRLLGWLMGPDHDGGVSSKKIKINK